MRWHLIFVGIFSWHCHRIFWTALKKRLINNEKWNSRTAYCHYVVVFLCLFFSSLLLASELPAIEQLLVEMMICNLPLKSRLWFPFTFYFCCFVLFFIPDREYNGKTAMVKWIPLMHFKIIGFIVYFMFIVFHNYFTTATITTACFQELYTIWWQFFFAMKNDSQLPETVGVWWFFLWFWIFVGIGHFDRSISYYIEPAIQNIVHKLK